MEEAADGHEGDVMDMSEERDAQAAKTVSDEENAGRVLEKTAEDDSEGEKRIFKL